MDCNCGFPVRHTIYRDGRPCFTCAVGGCKFFGFNPVQCQGYERIVATNRTPPETSIVRFEALLHPVTQEPAVMLAVSTPNNLKGDPTEQALRRVCESPAFSPAFYITKQAYLYPYDKYPAVVAAVKRVPYVLVQEIPTFFFRTSAAAQQLPVQHREAVTRGSENPLDTSDYVFTQLKEFQKRGVEFVVSRGGRGMIADDMGLGKTIQAIATAHHYRANWPVLVVCPMSLMENWAKEFNKFCAIPFSRITILQGAKARPDAIHEVVIVSYSSLKCMENEKYRVVILDESHYIKAGDTKRAQLAVKLCNAAERVVLLSGTPAMSRPMELYTQLSAIHPRLVPSKTQYGARYCNAHVGRFGMDYQGHSHVSELHFLLRDFVIRRTKKELSETELPSKSRQLLYVYITAKEKKALEKQVMALRKSVTGGGGGSSSSDYASRAPNAFELKVATARAKIPAVQDYVASVVEQHLESGEKVIFFAHHQCMMEAIKSAVLEVRPKHPLDYIYISGETPAHQREQLATHFRHEPTCAVAILSMGSSGTGHNFTCASTVVFAELDWTPSLHLQCEDRIHRIGQSRTCTIKYLLADGTSDDVIWPMLQEKLAVTSALLESSDSHRLSDNAARQKVSRRDLSTEAATSQGTLDGFVKVSSGSSQVVSSGSPSGNIPQRGPGGGDETSSSAAIIVLDDDGDERSRLALTDPVGQCGDSLPDGRSGTANTLATPPPADFETLPPSEAAGGGGGGPPQAVPAAAKQSPAAAPDIISIDELSRNPHLWRRPGRPERSGAASSRTHRPPRDSQGSNSGGARSLGHSPGASAQQSTTLQLQPQSSVLDMMKRSQTPTAATATDEVVVVADETRTVSPLPNTRPLLPQTAAGVRATALTFGGGISPVRPVGEENSVALAVSRVMFPPHATSSNMPVADTVATPRRTTFTLKLAEPAPVVPLTVPTNAAAVPVLPVASIIPDQQQPSPLANTVVSMPIKVSLRKRPFADVSAEAGPAAASHSAMSSSPAWNSTFPQQPTMAAARVEAPQPTVDVNPFGLSLGTDAATASTGGRRTTFRFGDPEAAGGGS